MLNKLLIKNFALIEKTEIEFDKGLNILSGETGAGKSILLEALNFVLGAKADKVLIRNGENECNVQAEFDITNNHQIKKILQELDLECDDTIIISRKMSIESKNSIKVNGNSVTLSMLKRITPLLVDIHGQSEHFFLLENKNQLKMIDDFCGDNVTHIKDKLAEYFTKYRNIIKQLEELGGDENNRTIRLDVLNFQINEIELASIQENEEEELLENKKKINNLQKINDALSCTKNGIEDEGCISDIISNISKMLNSIQSLSSEYSELYERVENCISELDDISSTCDNYLDNLNDNDLDINFIETRLDLIKSLKRKYGNSVQEINEFLLKAKEEKEKLENFDILSEKLVKEKSSLQDKIFDEYVSLRKEREKVAREFEKNVSTELKDLGFNNSIFEIKFNELINKEECKFTSSNGIDDIEFMFSANVGEPIKPLSVIISGGEISRFMLAVKAQTSKYNNIETFIFDEIDTGISGKIAKVVAQKFIQISNNTQIISITHLPQICVMGDTNFLIEKVVDNGKTISIIKKLDIENKKQEIIRLIGGESDSISANNLATELIDEANNFKMNHKY